METRGRKKIGPKTGPKIGSNTKPTTKSKPRQNTGSKPGPKRSYPLEKLIDLFEKYEEHIVLDGGKILRPNDDFWKKFKKINQIKKMSEKSIYSDALRWVQNREVKENVEASENYEHVNNSSGSDSESEISNDSYAREISEASDDSIKCEKGDIKFKVKLTPNVWKLIQPVSRSYQREADETHNSGVRNYLVLNPGFWTSVFVDKIAEHSKNIICDLAFKNSHVRLDGKYYITIYANCVTCQSTLVGYLEKEPSENEDVEFTCILKNFNKIRHSESKKNVRVTGSQAKELANSRETAIALHRKISAKSGEMFKLPKGRTPSANAIRLLQSRNRAKDRLSSDIFTALLYLKESQKYGGTIKMIGLSPFYTIYGSENQLRLYNMFAKKCATTKISCDATGSVVRKISKLFLFNKMCIVKILDSFC